MKIIYVKQISPPVFSASCWLLDTIPEGPIAEKFHKIMVEQDNKHVTGRQPVEYNNKLIEDITWPRGDTNVIFEC